MAGRMYCIRILLPLASLFTGTVLVSAGETTIVGVRASAENAGTWRFDVTLEHADEGWDHYADQWQVELEDGTVLGERVLLHPHVNEQPFTRSLSGVAVPAATARVYVSARDTVHGRSAARFEVLLAR